MSPARSITTVIIAQNEAPRIGDAILSCVTFSDEIVVIDGGSDDGTPEIARGLGCIVHLNPWPGYAAQRNFAAQKASHDWIFFIDSDEIVGEDLARSIDEWRSMPAGAGDEPGGYVITRRGDFLGRWMAGQEIVRLYDRRRHRIKDVVLDEEVDLPPARAGRLKGTLWHFGFRSLDEHLARFNRYTQTWAREAVEGGARFSLARLLLRPPARFLQRYLGKGLFRKGVPGLAASAFWGYFEVIKELKVLELRWRESDGGSHEKPRSL